MQINLALKAITFLKRFFYFLFISNYLLLVFLLAFFQLFATLLLHYFCFLVLLFWYLCGLPSFKCLIRIFRCFDFSLLKDFVFQGFLELVLALKILGNLVLKCLSHIFKVLWFLFIKNFLFILSCKLRGQSSESFTKKEWMHVWIGFLFVNERLLCNLRLLLSCFERSKFPLFEQLWDKGCLFTERCHLQIYNYRL